MAEDAEKSSSCEEKRESDSRFEKDKKTRVPLYFWFLGTFVPLQKIHADKKIDEQLVFCLFGLFLAKKDKKTNDARIYCHDHDEFMINIRTAEEARPELTLCTRGHGHWT
jgi:hypothetical protein